ncbi:unnamed protein product [Onchocerca flexuosa]|uniref:Uncharacterized protein n=1 Tax=Onchocerca flexuosa TaxID=387005 RepID=A0A183HJV3_9BILA|nr:unnamed protein product [Onchocerca flexuosa]
MINYICRVLKKNWKLFRWFTETSESEILEIGDEDWNPPVPESSFCNTEPATGINSTTMQRSLCPWQWKFVFCFFFF